MMGRGIGGLTVAGGPMSHEASHTRVEGAAHSPRHIQKHSMRENLMFMGKFFRGGRRIASIWPSSVAMSRATIGKIDWERAKVIVELGAGTGAITEQIVRRLQAHTTLLSIERDADFVGVLRRRFAGHHNVEIVQADVRDLDPLFEARGIKRVDAFVSGLPTPSLPKGVREPMLASVRRYLAADGVFSNITEVPFWYWRVYRQLFKEVSFELVVRNMPPGGVYHCRACR
jgi:ornithine lipid N-methyltransferase